MQEMAKWFALTLIAILITTCTSVATQEPEPNATEVQAEELFLPTLTLPAVPSPTAKQTTTPLPPTPPERPSDAEALRLMYPDEDTGMYGVMLSAPFRQDGRDTHLVLTNDTRVAPCPGCRVAVEAALMVVQDGTWQLEILQHIAAELSTNLDTAPTAAVIPLGPDRDGILFSGGYQGQGYIISTDTYVAAVNGRFTQVFSLTTYESNRLSDACFEQRLCYEYEATADFIHEGDVRDFGLRVTSGGTKLVEDQVIGFTDVATYTFTGQTYALTDRVQANATPPTPAASPTPAAPILEGPAITYNGITFTIDPALGEGMAVDEAPDPLGCTSLSFAPEGTCPEVGCITVCPVAAYREEILFGDDIIDGLSSAIETGSTGYFPSLMTRILLRSRTQHVSFRNGAGIRAIVMKAQNLVLANNESVTYEFHGLTDDGQAYVQVIIPVDSSILLNTYDPSENTNAAAIPAPELPEDDFQIGVVTREYNEEVQRQLDLLEAGGFTPDLGVLDALVGSLLITP